MQKNLTTKTLVIVATILLCIYGIIGPGVPTSKVALMKNLKENVRLGLDLRGGSLLILQVQVQDALKAEADNVMDRLKEDVKRADIDYASMDRNDPMRIEDADSIQINIKGVPAQKSSAFRGLVADHFSAVDPDAGGLRLPHELEAERTVSSEVGYGGAVDPDHQQPD